MTGFCLVLGQIVVALIGAWVIWIIGAIAYGLVGPYLPIPMQRPLFRVLQNQLLQKVADDPTLSPVIGLPFLIFVETTLPQVFEKEGFFGCQRAVQGWFDNYIKELTKESTITNPPK